MQIASRRRISIEAIVVALAFAPSLTRAYEWDDSGGEKGGCGHKDRDFFVSHVSTLPANAGQEVKLFVRERGNSCGPPVLMLGGTTQPAMATFDLPYQDPQLQNYSWMTYLANAGFDVFVMDLQGYGFSTRPEVMDDPCNATTTAQAALLTPKPLKTPCPVITSIYPYPFLLTNNQSEWDQIDSVVDHILAARHQERVSLVGWSYGGPRAGGYASRHPEKVERLFLYAPAYLRGDPDSLPVPQPGNPLTVNTVSAFFARWDTQVKCPDQFDPGVRRQLTASLLDFDPLAATWGTQALWRSPSFVQDSSHEFGWNSAAAARLHMPILMIRGDYDVQVPLTQVRDLFSDVSSESKVFVHVACGAHQLVWDRQHTRLFDASVQWLKDGRYNGARNGCFAVDTNGKVTSDTSSATPCGQ
jgi:pimeloyl-ACP methyl ester carboxylesterase